MSDQAQQIKAAAWAEGYAAATVGPCDAQREGCSRSRPNPYQ